MAEPRRRGTLGRTVAVGLVSAGLGAVAGAKPWAAPETTQADPLGTISSAAEVPLGLALALVTLACWGVVLTTRGRVRRWVAALGCLAAVGLVVVVVHAALILPDRVTDAATEAGLARVGTAHLTGWFWVAAVCAVLSVLATAAAVRLAPGWPSMGSRYDAPGSAATPRREVGPGDRVEEIDLWKSMDEGHDPTG